MEISVALRGGENKTDWRVLAIAKGLSYLPHTVTLIGRARPIAYNTDLLVHTGFGGSTALLSAIESRTPYLIMEGPIFRDMYDMDTTSNFTYNGLQQGGTRPEAPLESRPHPLIHPEHFEGPTLILAQKTTDHSLRGSDHVKWLKEQLDVYPEAQLRHHPIMVPPEYNIPISDALVDVGRTVAFTSTASVDSLLAGCETICGHPANEAYGCTDREEWVHKLSWSTFTHAELATSDITAWILTGFEEARRNAFEGRQEIPRARVDGGTSMGAYYSEFPYDER
ncbi:MAG: hypothetical protein V3T23_08505 [Nitrososphaerales archaeon]